MGNLRRKVAGLQERFYRPIHRDEPLLCSECDMKELPDEELDELELLMEQAGYPYRPPIQSVGPCWCCGEGTPCCLECANEREEPPGMALMSEADLDRMHELAAKLVPPWL
jgi:hypothetical protein